jgi:hypothetical protein
MPNLIQTPSLRNATNFLFTFSPFQDAKPAAPGISLKKSTLNKSPEGVKKDFVFALESKEANLFFAVYSKKD